MNLGSAFLLSSGPGKVAAYRSAIFLAITTRGILIFDPLGVPASRHPSASRSNPCGGAGRGALSGILLLATSPPPRHEHAARRSASAWPSRECARLPEFCSKKPRVDGAVYRLGQWQRPSRHALTFQPARRQIARRGANEPWPGAKKKPPELPARRQHDGVDSRPKNLGFEHPRPPCGGHRSITTQRLHDVIVVRGGGRAHAALSQALMDASATARLLLAFCVPPALVLLVAASSSSRTRVLFGTVWPRSAAGRNGGPPRHACGAGEGGDSAPGRGCEVCEVFPRKSLTNNVSAACLQNNTFACIVVVHEHQ